jgi:SlyX protein
MIDRLEQIEVRIAYLEQANTQLSDELVKQQAELEKLRMQLAALLQRQDAAQSAPTVYTAEEEKPPHY